MNIRVGSDADIPKLIPILAEFHRLNGLDLPEINWEKVFQSMLMVNRQGIMLLAETEGKEIAGILALVTTEPWYSSERIIVDQVFYVAQKYRQSSAGIRLRNMAKKVARDMEMRLILAVFGNVDLEKKEKFIVGDGRGDFQRLGGTYGMGFRKAA